MQYIRPVSLEDLDALEQLAQKAGGGLRNFPKERTLLERHVEAAVAAFSEKPVQNRFPPLFSFVLEDAPTQRLLGVCAIKPSISPDLPIIAFQQRLEISRDPISGVKKARPVLHPRKIHQGLSEICGLFLDPDFRKSGLGPLLSFSRFLFIACFPQLFEPTIFAEMRGCLDPQGNCPFWEAVGRPLYGLEFAEAEALFSRNPLFFSHLLPRHPIYLDLFPSKIRDLVGKPHPNTTRAIELLKRQGFSLDGHLDIFDGGPNVRAAQDRIWCIKESQNAQIHKISTRDAHSKSFLVSNGRFEHFRACITGAQFTKDGALTLNENAAQCLQVSQGALVRVVPLYAQEKTPP